jgi:CAAX protease family protein
MAVAFSGFVLFVVATGAVYLADAAASTRRFAGIWRICGMALSIVLTLIGLRLVWIAVFNDQSTIIAAVASLAVAATLAIVLSQNGRRLISAVLPLNRSSPRDWLGLLAVVWLVIFRLALFYRGNSEIGEVHFAEAAIQTLVLVGIASAMIGLFVRRDLRQSLRRLGIVRLDLRAIAISAFAVLPFAVVAALTVLFVDFVQPGTMERLAETVTDITGGQTSLQFGLVLGISAAVGEETLFRGALQPKYGLVFTSLIFALLHVQYDLLLIVASLFPVGIILGLERKYLGTTASMITHALYNALVVVGGY